MQTLYAGLQEDETNQNLSVLLKNLNRHLDESLTITITLIHLITEVARYAEKDALNRAAKNLPSFEDLNVNTKLSGNTLLWQILEHPSYQVACKSVKPELRISDEWVKKIYLELTKSPAFFSYIKQEGRDKKEEKAILDFIFNSLILPNENLTDYLEEIFIHWQDDAEMMELLVPNFLLKLNNYNFQRFISEEKRNYACDLLKAVLEKKEVCSRLIESKLQNWDPERTALLDMILMRMGICEFLYFETIPPKVTINEYIDLAKEYSTPQSGHFVNGILDSIRKELETENKLHKVSHKK